MTSAPAAPLLFLQLLADRTGRPGAVLLQGALGPDAAPAACRALADGLRAQGARFCCVYPDGLAAPLAEALAQAGWLPLPAGSVLSAGGGAATAAPSPAIAWLSADWCLAPLSPAPAGKAAQASQAASRAIALQLVQLVTADADSHAIEALLRREPALSYHLLRLVNSVGGGRRRVTSFAQAILILGRQQLRRWLNLMLFAARDDDVRSQMLLALVARRACAMELLARARGMDKLQQEQAFMTGMFSLLGVLFGLPLASVLQPLAISEVVLEALLAGSGELGAMLALLVAAEAGRQDEVAPALQSWQLAPQEFNRIVVDAHLWMAQVLAAPAAGSHA